MTSIAPRFAVNAASHNAHIYLRDQLISKAEPALRCQIHCEADGGIELSNEEFTSSTPLVADGDVDYDEYMDLCLSPSDDAATREQCEEAFHENGNNIVVSLTLSGTATATQQCKPVERNPIGRGSGQTDSNGG